MTYQCPQCGNTTEQAANFCRKCGAPIPTIALSTVPLTSVPTTGMPAVKKEEDPFDTWEPQAPPAAATEVLPAAQPVTATIAPSATTAAIPPTQTKGLPVAAEPKITASQPAKSKQGALMAAAVVALLAIVGIGLFLKNRTSTPAIETVTPTTATVTPELSVAPIETAATETATPAANETAASAMKSPAPAGAKASPTIKADAKATPTAPAVSTANAYPAPTPTAAEPVKETPVENSGSLIEQGNRFASAGQFQEAIQAYEKARRANPGNADVYYLLGSAYHRSGDLTNALESYRKCSSGNYASVAANHVKNLEKKLGKKG